MRPGSGDSRRTRTGGRRPGRQRSRHRIGVARFDADGQADTTFGTFGTGVVITSSVRTSFVTALAVAPDERVYVVGAAGDGQPHSDWLLAAFRPDGTLDAGFGADGVVTRTPGSDDVATMIVLQPNGRLLVSGTAGGTVVLARYHGTPRACGDTDGNTEITVTDGVQALRAAADLASSCLPEFCDVDGSGAVTVTDCVRILRAAADLPGPLGCSD